MVAIQQALPTSRGQGASLCLLSYLGYLSYLIQPQRPSLDLLQLLKLLKGEIHPLGDQLNRFYRF